MSATKFLRAANSSFISAYSSLADSIVALSRVEIFASRSPYIGIALDSGAGFVENIGGGGGLFRGFISNHGRIRRLFESKDVFVSIIYTVSKEPLGRKIKNILDTRLIWCISMPETNPEVTTIRVHKSTRTLLNEERDELKLPSVEAVILSFLRDLDNNLDIQQARRILQAYDQSFSILVEYPDAFKEVSRCFLKLIKPGDKGVLQKLVENNGTSMVR